MIDEALDAFARLDVGKQLKGRGILLMIQPETQRARVEVGYALEPFITDIQASKMLNDYLAPYFKNKAWATAIEASIEALVDEVNAKMKGKSVETFATKGSGGAGYTLRDLAHLDPSKLSEKDKQTLRQILAPQDAPQKLRPLEIAVMKKGIYFKDAPMYDNKWRKSPDRNFSPRRIKEIAKDLDRPFQVKISGEYAISYYEDVRHIGPSFYKKHEGGWIMDMSAVNQMVIYDYSNQNWYVLDNKSTYLKILKEVFPMKRGSLGSGRSAWMRK